MKKNNRNGFTLTELLVTIVILGLITGLSLPIIHNVQEIMERKKYDMYVDSFLSSAKLYVDSYSEDLFGHLDTGCAVIKYSDLINKKLIKDIDVPNISCASEDTKIKVVKFKGHYSYKSNVVCGKTNNSGNIIETKYSNNNGYNDERCQLDSNSITVSANPNKYEKNDHKRDKMKVTLSSETGINEGLIITYRFVDKNGNSMDDGNFKNVVFKLPSETEQIKKIENSNADPIVISSDEIVTPQNLTDELYLLLNVERLHDLSGRNWSPSGETSVRIGPYKVDNSSPIISSSSLVSNNNNYNDLEPYLKLSARDDKFSSNNDMWVCYYYEDETDSSCNVNGRKLSDFAIPYNDFISGKQIRHNIHNSLNGSKHTIRGVVYDNAKNKANFSVDYTVAAKIHYDKGDADGNQTMTDTICNVDSNCYLKANTFTYTGHDFVQWNYNNNVCPNPIKLTNGSITVVAQWKWKTYTVSYNLDNGSGNFPNQTKTYGVTLKLSDTVPTKDGYTFNGWKGSDDKNYSKGSNFTGNYNLTLTAQWKLKTYTVQYQLDGGQGNVSSQTKTHGITLKLSNVVPTKDGYTFNGWKGSDNNNYSKGSNFTGNYNLTLTAQWKLKTYTVQYQLDGGQGNVPSQTKTHGVTLTLSNNVPTKNGHTFNGWKGSDDNNYSKGSNFTGNYDLTLKAKWKINTYTVTYHLDGGSGSFSAQTKTHDATLALSNNVPTKSGYTFNGWKGSDNKIYSKGSNFTGNYNLTLTAQWNPHVLTITYTKGNSNATVCSSNNKIPKTTKYYGDTFNLADYHNANAVCYQYDYHMADGNKAWHIHDTSTYLSQSTNYTAVQIASWAGCDLSQNDCNVSVNVVWRKTRVRSKYFCNGGKVTHGKCSNPEHHNESLVGRTDANHGYCYLGGFEDYDATVLNTEGVRNHNPANHRNGTLLMSKNNCTPTNYYHVGSSNASKKINEDTTYATMKAYAEATGYGEALKSTDVTVPLYADWSC